MNDSPQPSGVMNWVLLLLLSRYELVEKHTLLQSLALTLPAGHTWLRKLGGLELSEVTLVIFDSFLTLS